MSQFHKYVKDMYDEYSKPDVNDEYFYVRKAQIFWAEVQKFEGSGTLKITLEKKISWKIKGSIPEKGFSYK